MVFPKIILNTSGGKFGAITEINTNTFREFPFIKNSSILTL